MRSGRSYLACAHRRALPLHSSELSLWMASAMTLLSWGPKGCVWRAQNNRVTAVSVAVARAGLSSIDYAHVWDSALWMGRASTLNNIDSWLVSTNWSMDATVAAATRELMGSGCEGLDWTTGVPVSSFTSTVGRSTAGTGRDGRGRDGTGDNNRLCAGYTK